MSDEIEEQEEQEEQEDQEEPKFTKSQMIMKIKFMSKDEYLEFSELVEDWFDIKRYHKEYIKYSKKFEETDNLKDLEEAVINFMNSKKCRIHEVKWIGGDSLWVSYDTYPPRSKSLSYSIRSMKDFIEKYPY